MIESVRVKSDVKESAMNWFAKTIFNGKRNRSKFGKLYLAIVNNRKRKVPFNRPKFLLYSLVFIIGFVFIFLVSRAISQCLSVENDIKLGQQIYLNSKKNMSVDRTIDVVMGVDDGYVQHSAATIASILLNCDTSSNFRFHILDGGISSDKKEKLLKLKKLRDFDIRFYDMTKYDWSMFPNNRRYITLATYYRLRITDVLPKNLKKALYLDGDMIVEQDLKELWDTDISDYVLGAVVECSTSKENECFNAGMLLLNLEKLRKTNLIQNSLKYLEENRKQILFQDQDILNGLFNLQYKKLPLKWNVFADIHEGLIYNHTYTDQEAKIAQKCPGIIHFSGGVSKPWSPWVYHPLYNEYWKYSKYTEFYSPNQKKSSFLQLIWERTSFVKYLFNKISNKFQNKPLSN